MKIAKLFGVCASLLALSSLVIVSPAQSGNGGGQRRGNGARRRNQVAATTKGQVHTLAKVTKQLPPINVDTSAIQLNTKSPIPYKPLPMVDGQGNPLSPTATATLPNGKTITAKDYFEQMNQLEQRLNKYGMTLRDKTPKYDLGHTKIDEGVMKVQATKLKSFMVAGTPQDHKHPRVRKSAPTKFPVKTLPKINPRLGGGGVGGGGGAGGVGGTGGGGNKLQSGTAPNGRRRRGKANNASNLPGGGTGGQELEQTQIALQNIHKFNTSKVKGDTLNGIMINPLQFKGIYKGYKFIEPGTIQKFGGWGKIFGTGNNWGILHINPFPFPQVTEVDVSHSKGWNWSAGNSWFGCYYNGNFGVNGKALGSSYASQSSEFHVASNAVAGINLLNANVDVVSVTANYDSYAASNSGNVNESVYIIGIKIWGNGQAFQNNYTNTSTWQMPIIEQHATGSIQIGPFQIYGTIGAIGIAGMTFNVVAYPSNISGSVTPFIHTSAYAQVGAGIDFGVASASAGIGGNLTLFNDDLTLGVNVGIGWLIDFFLQDEFYVDNSMNSLSGNFYWFLKLSECFGAFNQEWDYTMWNWPGYTDNSEWVNIRNVTPLNWS